MPETKFGKCGLCGKHNVVLWFALGQHNGKLWCDWICKDCLNVTRNLPEVKQDAKQGKGDY